MHKALILVFLVTAAGWAENAAGPAENKVPAGAKAVGPGTYSYTDAQGKPWIYRETPFGGVYKLAPADVAMPAAQDANPTTATELGDSVRFEHRTPFGVTVWTRKKSDLTAEERGILDTHAASRKWLEDQRTESK
jgi:hypothetical protein